MHQPRTRIQDPVGGGGVCTGRFFASRMIARRGGSGVERSGGLYGTPAWGAGMPGVPLHLVPLPIWPHLKNLLVKTGVAWCGVGAFMEPCLGDGMPACGMPETLMLHDARSRHGTRAAIKAPTLPSATPAPTDVDRLFLRLMRIGRGKPALMPPGCYAGISVLGLRLHSAYSTGAC